MNPKLKIFIPKQAEESLTQSSQAIERVIEPSIDINGLNNILKLTKEHAKKIDETLNSMKSLDRKYQELEEYRKNEYLFYRDFQEDVRIAHYSTMDIFNYCGVYIWKNSTGSTIYYRINPFGKKEKIHQDDDYKILLGEFVNVFDITDDVRFYDNAFILVKNLLPLYNNEVFYPQSSEEFTFLNTNNNYQFRNTFQYSTYLYNRNVNRLNKADFIANFLSAITTNIDECDYIIEWLAYFFQSMQKTDIALVLIGDSEVSDILINQIIQPIFAYRKEYFESINDDTLKKKSETIIKDKIFYHIGELSQENITNKKISNLVVDMLKPNRYHPDEAIEINENYVWGQLIVTAERETPFPFLKDSYSQCSVFRIKDMDSILRKLDVTRIELETSIQNDLENFSNMLAQISLDYSYFPTMGTHEKDALPTMKNGVLITRGLEKKIKNFIKNIEVKNLNYFENIKKENSNMYEELEHNFNENMIAQPLLRQYFNLVYKDIIFYENNHLLDILKDRSEIFKKAPDDKSKYNGKKRYTIIY